MSALEIVLITIGVLVLLTSICNILDKSEVKDVFKKHGLKYKDSSHSLHIDATNNNLVVYDVYSARDKDEQVIDCSKIRSIHLYKDDELFEYTKEKILELDSPMQYNSVYLRFEMIDGSTVDDEMELIDSCIDSETIAIAYAQTQEKIDFIHKYRPLTPDMIPSFCTLKEEEQSESI